LHKANYAQRDLSETVIGITNRVPDIALPMTPAAQDKRQVTGMMAVTDIPASFK